MKKLLNEFEFTFYNTNLMDYIFNTTYNTNTV